jgi:uncharacterized repeat protein (TIGR01451 family)
VLLNPNGTAATAVALTDALPAGVVIATPLVISSNTCAFSTAGVIAGAGSIPLSGGTIPALSGGTPGQCQIQINVVAASANTYLNTIGVGAVSSSQGSNSQAAQATLVVSTPANITGAKAFSPTNVHGNGTKSTLTITLTNPNGIPLTNAALTDSLPAATTVATPPNAGTTCGAGTATPSSSATNPATIALSGGTLPANGSCTLFVDVVARNPDTLTNGNQANTIPAGALTTTEGATSPAITASIDVQTGASVAKAFAPTPIAPNGASAMTITVTNFNETILTPITFTDTFPATIAATAVPATTCGGTISTVPPQPAPPPYTAFTLTGGSLAAVVGPGTGSTTCTITAPVTANATGTNTLAANNYGGVVIAAASGTLAVSAVTGSKTFTTPALQTGSTTMTVTLNNLTATPATITSFTDLLTTMGAGFTVGGAPIIGPGDCGATITAPLGGTSITATGGTIPANGSCTITIPVAISATAATGNRTNTIAVGAVKTSAGNNTVAITGTVNVQRALTVTKAFAPATIEAGAVSRLTVTMTPTVALTGVAFTDALTTMGAGFAVASTPNVVVTNCGAGTVTTTANSFTLSGATLTAGTNCTVAINVATPATAGTFTNTIPAANITTTQGVTTSAVTANLALIASSVTINKSFSPTTVPLGATNPGNPNFSTLSIQIRNNNAGAINLTGVGLTDNLTSIQPGLLVANPPTAAFSGAGCGGATISAPAGATQIVLSTATVNAASICTLSVRVVGTISGNLINTVAPQAISSAQGVTNPLQGTATLAVTGSVHLTITKSDGVTSAVPGTSTTYTIGVTNSGPNDVTGLVVDDTPPVNMTFASWTCTASAGSACPASGSGPIAASVTVLNGGTVTFTVVAPIAANATGSITNTASLAVPGSVIDTNPITSASDTDTLTPQADLGITKTDGVTSVAPGNTTTYTIVVSNSGPSSVTGAAVTDVLPAAISSATFTAVGSGGASGFTASGSGNINDTVNLPVGSTITYTLHATVAANATGNLMNTATVTPPAGVTDPNPGNNSATDTDTLTPQADLAITKTDGVTSVNAGGNTTYTIVVSNSGPSAANGAVFTDPVVANLGVTSVTCGSPSGGAACPTAANTTVALMQGAGIVIPTLPPGGSVTFTVKATVAGNATGTITNTANIAAPSGVTDPNPGNNSASDSDTVSLVADLAITKTDGVTSVDPGGTTTYTIVVSNSGPSSVTGATVTDVLPSAISSATFTAVGSGGASGFTASGSGNINDTVNLPVSSTITYTLHANIASSATGNLVNTATVTAPAGVTDPNPGNNSATDTDTLTPQVTLAVVKTDGSLTYTPGGTATYTITITDTGASDAANVTVSDALPPGVTLTANVTCVANGSASCGTVSGSIGGTSLGATGATISAGLGNSLVFTVPVAFASAMTTNPLVNMATATDVASGATASGSDSDALAEQVTLAVVKTDGSLTYTPGGTATYTVTVTHGGLSDATNVTVSDALPPGVTLTADASCVTTGSASCGTVTGLAGQASFGSTGAQIAAGAGNSLVFTAPVAFAATLTTDPLVNTATATDLLSGATGSGTDSDARSPQVSLSVLKTDGSPTYTPGGTATYTITVVDNGLTDALNVTVADTLPAGVTLTADVTCVAAGGANCGTVTGATGQTNFNATGATINAGGGSSLVFTVPVAFASNLLDNPLVNAATANDLASGATGSGSDSDVRAAQADLAVTKTDGVTAVAPGGTTTYTIVVTNNGPSDVTGGTVTDILPAAISSATFTAVGSGGASGFTASGSGNINDTVNLPAGSTITYTLVANIALSATGNLVNTATVIPPATVTDPNPGNNSATDTDTITPLTADLAITKSDGVTSVVPGGTTTYTIVVTNNGPAGADGAVFTDPAVANLGVTGVTCGSPSGGAACPTLPNTTVALMQGAGIVIPTLPSGGSVTFTVSATIAGNATGTIANTANIAAPSAVIDPNLGNNSATDTDTVTNLLADLAITKTDGVSSVVPGGTTTYTIVVTNNGPAGADGAVFTDPAAANLGVTGVTCGSASGGAACPTLPNTTVALMQGAGIVVPTLPPGGSVTFIVSATIAGNATGTIANTANIAAPGGVTDPNLSNNSATDTDSVVTAGNLALVKTDLSSTYTPGATAIYSITVTNNGPANAADLTVTDNLPTGLTLTAPATCAATGTASCGSIVSAVGGTTFSATGATLAVGAGNRLVYSLTVRFAASLTAAQITNVATATDAAAGSASGSDTNVLARNGLAQPIPADDRRALFVLACLILLSAWRWIQTLPRAGGGRS